MKANELQIGDWVLWGEHHSNIEDDDYNLEFYPQKIELNDFYFLYVNDWEYNEGLAFVKPIQLDEEILKANGFEKSYTENKNAHYSRSGVGLTLNLLSCTTTIMGKLVSVKYVHELQHDLRENKNAHYSRRCVGLALNLASYTTTIMGKLVGIKYVHELQHALRLCGLNELANNFKVDRR